MHDYSSLVETTSDNVLLFGDKKLLSGFLKMDGAVHLSLI